MDVVQPLLTAKVGIETNAAALAVMMVASFTSDFTISTPNNGQTKLR